MDSRIDQPTAEKAKESCRRNLLPFKPIVAALECPKRELPVLPVPAVQNPKVRGSTRPRCRATARSPMHGLVEFAMWAGLLDISRNPISLVQNSGAMRRLRGGNLRAVQDQNKDSRLRESSTPA